MPFPASDADWETVARLVTGELSPDEAAKVRVAIAQDPALARLLASLEHRAQETERVDVEAALASVHTRMGTQAGPALRLERPSRAWYTETWVRAAAAVVVIAGATWALTGRQQKPEV
ncbi:MAG TPA: hypothetical protein VE967_03460, partial [Gemmatimonadaceae bacterium]|nr:hypothetical protein [Gemmatimonadaceae bacterium]